MEAASATEHHEDHKRQEGKRLKEGTGHSVASEQKIGGDIKMGKGAPFLEESKKIFDELIAAQNQRYQGTSPMRL